MDPDPAQVDKAADILMRHAEAIETQTKVPNFNRVERQLFSDLNLGVGIPKNLKHEVLPLVQSIMQNDFVAIAGAELEQGQVAMDAYSYSYTGLLDAPSNPKQIQYYTNISGGEKAFFSKTHKTLKQIKLMDDKGFSPKAVEPIFELLWHKKKVCLFDIDSENYFTRYPLKKVSKNVFQIVSFDSGSFNLIDTKQAILKHNYN